MAEALSRVIIKSQQSDQWQGIQFGSKELAVTHSLFADDTLLFGLSSIIEAKYIKEILNSYTMFFGQNISKQKSKIFLFNTRSDVGRRICKILEFEQDHFPSSYLGVPFFMGSNKSSYWNNIVRRIKSRTMSWKVRRLTLSGRIMLIKSMLASIPNYFFLYYQNL